MANVTVTPSQFSLVLFDHAEILAIANKVVSALGIEQPVVVAVNESTPLQRVAVAGLDPITLDIESGAFEDPHRPRRASPVFVGAALSKVLFRVRDRLDGSFADAPPDDKLNHAQRSAWNVYAVGRSSRAGFNVQKQRQQYNFRNRHTFSDAADAVFEQLWCADQLTWSELSALSDSVAS
jgi:hypothetical protein